MNRNLKIILSSVIVLLFISSFSIKHSNSSISSYSVSPNYLTDDSTKTKTAKTTKTTESKTATKKATTEESGCKKTCSKTCTGGRPH